MKAMSLMQGVACKKVKPEAIAYVELRIPNNRVLSHQNVNSNGNDVQIARVSERYPVFKKSDNAATEAMHNELKEQAKCP